MKENKRISLVLDPYVLAYVDSEREKIGVSRAAMFSFMVEQYRNQKEALKVIEDVSGLVEKIEELNDKFDGSKA